MRAVFEQASRVVAQAQPRLVCDSLAARFPRAVALLVEAEEEVFAFYDCPPEPWRQIRTTNPLEWLNKAFQRQSAVVGIFPNRAALLRLFGALLAEENDEWLVGKRYFFRGLNHDRPGKRLGRRSIAGRSRSD